MQPSPMVRVKHRAAHRADRARRILVGCAAVLSLLLLIPAAPEAVQASNDGAGSSATDPTDAAAVLLKADADFDLAVAAKGVDAWVAAFAADGIMFRAGEIVRGRAAIRELMAPTFSTPGFSLRWRPVHADIAGSGDLGYTYGSYESVSPGSAGEPVKRTGMYVTIWKKQVDGSWKVAVDLGSAAPPPPPNPSN
jgi:ketosteroid isomerase-like protein